MDEHSAAATMAFGMESITGRIDLLCICEMGSWKYDDSFSFMVSIVWWGS